MGRVAKKLLGDEIQGCPERTFLVIRIFRNDRVLFRKCELAHCWEEVLTNKTCGRAIPESTCVTREKRRKNGMKIPKIEKDRARSRRAMHNCFCPRSLTKRCITTGARCTTLKKIFIGKKTFWPFYRCFRDHFFAFPIPLFLRGFCTKEILKKSISTNWIEMLIFQKSRFYSFYNIFYHSYFLYCDFCQY